MDELKKLLKTIRLEKFVIRESALIELPLEEIPLEPVYVNNDDKSELKNLTNTTAKELADIAIFR
ncbi:MAG: hypothetical protein ABI723_08220 [Bacteroidia bacterium]